MSKTGKAKDKGKKRKTRARGSARRLGASLLKWTAVLAIWGIFIGLCFVAWLAYDLPDLSRLTNAARRPSITLVTTDGQILASYGDLYGKQVNLDELPPYLPDALLATGDRRFYSHFGVDPQGLMRAIVTNIRAGRLVQGGSTITQQLAKNVFLTPDRTVRRKYFGKPAAKATPFEAAMLAGMVKAPSRYNPLSDPTRATDRAKLVLASMVAAGYMTDADAGRAISQGVANLKTPTAASGQYYADWVLDQVSSYVNYIDRDLVVVTTIDAQAQQAAEAV